MKTMIALFRGLNVGGSSSLPMTELKAQLEELGLQRVHTIIQSGNAIFEAEPADDLAERIRAAIQEKYGVETFVWLLTPATLQRVLKENPFPQAEADPKSLHIYFMASKSKEGRWDKIEDLRKDNERYEIKGNVFYLHAPDGIGRSRLVAALEKQLGLPVTGRNWRSLNRILAAAQENA